MTYSFSDAITKATALTKAGRLQEATALLQASLKGPTTPDTDSVLEGTYVRLDQSQPQARSTAPRAPLGETLRRIAAGGMPLSGPHHPAHTALPSGAEFLALTHVGTAGTLNYRLYLPRNRTHRMPLVVMLHGCTQSPEDFAAGTGMNSLAEEFGCLIAYPAQPTRANAQKCWNWFRPEDQGNGQGEPALIAGMTREILAAHPVDPALVYLAGLSAGGAAALITGSAYPTLFSAIGVHSGLPIGAAYDVPSAFAAMRNGSVAKPVKASLPTIVFHGLEDTTVNVKNGRAILGQVTRNFPGLTKQQDRVATPGLRIADRTRYADSQGRIMAELWEVEGAGHAWAGGRSSGSYTDPTGPDASGVMLQFFLQHSKA